MNIHSDVLQETRNRVTVVAVSHKVHWRLPYKHSKGL